jgi:hypothetical protein
VSNSSVEPRLGTSSGSVNVRDRLFLIRGKWIDEANKLSRVGEKAGGSTGRKGGEVPGDGGCPRCTALMQTTRGVDRCPVCRLRCNCLDYAEHVSSVSTRQQNMATNETGFDAFDEGGEKGRRWIKMAMANEKMGVEDMWRCGIQYT